MAALLAKLAVPKVAAPLSAVVASRSLSQSATLNSFPANKEGRIPVTMIPGDGVGPELMDSVKDVLNRIGAPIDFETYHLSEVR
jgi:isocitrate dehydrogenase (NAD+)